MNQSIWLKYHTWHFDINRNCSNNRQSILCNAFKPKGLDLVKKLILSADINQWNINEFKKLIKWILNILIFTNHNIIPDKIYQLPKQFRNIKNFTKQLSNIDSDKKGKLLEIPYSFLLCLFSCLNINERYNIPNTQIKHSYFSNLIKIECLIDCLLDSQFIDYIYITEGMNSFRLERIGALYQLIQRETRHFSDNYIQELKDCVEKNDHRFHCYGIQFSRILQKIDKLLRNLPSNITKQEKERITYKKDINAYNYELIRTENSPQKEVARKIISHCLKQRLN